MIKKSTKKINILVASGVNLDLLGKREPHIYGLDSLEDMELLVKVELKKWLKRFGGYKVKVKFFQTNDESKFLSELDKGYDGAVINAGAWTHTSLAISDRLKGLALPYVEVHVSDISKREAYRQVNFLKESALASIQGLGIKGYAAGLEKLLSHMFAI